MQKGGEECACITIIFINFLFVYKKKDYFQVYLDKCVYRIVEKQMTWYLEHDLIEFDDEY